ncbi:hypothetical protein GGS21DRAFT_355278 [Xylaria nigripes]|nr:hypothetical protein GGS21DRAFT_355278 [Xylaria nigripes]
MHTIEDSLELELPPNPPSGNLTTFLDTLKAARTENEPVEVKRSSQVSPTSQSQSDMTVDAACRSNVQSQLGTHLGLGPSYVNQTARSFLLPNLSHVNDFVSGSLKWSSLKNGTPIFVKHGKVYDRETMVSLDHHADFEDVAIPLEEEQIFVSLDKIREEIQTLQEHDGIVSKQAEELQDEVCGLQSQIAKLMSRKDSAMGSDSESSIIVQLSTQKSQLEEQLAAYKSRLEQANRKISVNDIHSQSFVAERDEALQRASDHVTTIKRLQSRNDTITQQKLELQQALRLAEEDLCSERELLDDLRHKYDLISEEKSLLKQDHLSLERHNDDLFNENRLLQQKNGRLERDNTHLQKKVTQLEDLVEELNERLAKKTETPQYTRESKDVAPGPAKSKPSKVAQNWNLGDRRSAMGKTSAKVASQMHLPKHDNDTRESDLTRESGQYTQESMSVSGKSKSTKSANMREFGDKHTVMSEMSAKTTTSKTDLQMQDDYTQHIDLTREAQLNSDQENMTSALFIDDITLDSNNRPTQKPKAKTPTVRVLSPILSVAEPTTEIEQTGTEKQRETPTPPTLTQSAKRVLNNLCRDHECLNCVLCTRIQAHRHEPTGKQCKKTVRVDRPVPVTDRVKSQPSVSAHGYEDQPTLRPSQDPAIALAKVMKGLKDEERHIRFAMAKKQVVYDECDPAINKRLWKQLDAEIRVLRKRRDLKRDQIYDLHDVLEGQKANAQLMSQEAIDMTITSVLSKDPTWNGVLDY